MIDDCTTVQQKIINSKMLQATAGNRWQGMATKRNPWQGMSSKATNFGEVPADTNSHSYNCRPNKQLVSVKVADSGLQPTVSDTFHFCLKYAKFHEY